MAMKYVRALLGIISGPPITFTEVDQKNNIIEHSSHKHPMTLVEMDNKDKIICCFGCESTICKDDQVYGCTKCKHFLHESCAKLPKEVQCPFHWEHGRLFLCINDVHLPCKLCNIKRNFCFKCRECKAWLCVKCCPTGRGTFKYEYHEHLLCFTEKGNTMPNSRCSNYDSYCKRPAISYGKELSYTHSCAFYCLECDFKVHLLCGPLSSMIKDECHIHPLTLTDSVVQENYEEYYCDICETEIDPRIRVYYCNWCNYTAHVHCLASKIIKIVKGELKDVKLKNVGDDFWIKTDDNDDDHNQPPEDPSSLISLKDLINSLSETEKWWLKEKYEWDDEDVSTSFKGEAEEFNKLGDADDNDILPILQLSRFTDEDFRKIFNEFHRLYLSKKLELKSRDLGLKIVTSLKGYKIPLVFQPLLKALFDKYGDVSSNSKTADFKTIEGKSMLYFLLCRVLKGMCNTKVGDISRNHLQQWYYHLRFVRDWGNFEIGFAFEHLERLVGAFLGLQAKRLQDEIPAMLNKKMATLEEKIGEVKSKLKRCEEYGGSSAKSEFMKNCLKEASQLKWKNACEGLL